MDAPLVTVTNNPNRFNARIPPSAGLEELAQSLHLRLEALPKPRVSRSLAVCVAKSRFDLTRNYREIPPADDAFVPEQRQRVVAELALTRRGVSLESIGPAPEDLEAAAVPDDRVERGQ